MYKPLFKEAFLKKDMEKAIELTSKIIGKRLGDKIYLSPLITSFEKMGQGQYYGMHGTMKSGKQIRYNWKMSDTSGAIDSIDIWYDKKYDPSITIDVNGLNIVKIIDAIVEAIQKKVPNEYFALAESKIIYERTNPASTKNISKDISNSINTWLKEMNVDENKLANTRISYLHKDFEFWRNEVAENKYKSVSLPTFTKYILLLLEKNNITNIFVRKIRVKNATHDNTHTNASDQKKFDAALYAMSLQDTIEFVKASVRAITRGFENALIIAGTAGIGKTRLVEDVLKEDNVQYKKVTGGIKNTQAFFELLKRNNKDNFIIFFDDVDDIFQKKNEDMMKAATAPDKIRQINWYK